GWAGLSWKFSAFSRPISRIFTGSITFRPQRRAGPCLSRVSLELGHFVPLLAHFPFLPRQAVGQERLRGARFNRRGGSEHDVAARLPEVSVGRSDTRLYRVVCRWSCRIYFRAASCNEAPP